MTILYEGSILIESVLRMVMDEISLTRVASRGVTDLYLWRRNYIIRVCHVEPEQG